MQIVYKYGKKTEGEGIFLGTIGLFEKHVTFRGRVHSALFEKNEKVTGARLAVRQQVSNHFFYDLSFDV